MHNLQINKWFNKENIGYREYLSDVIDENTLEFDINFEDAKELKEILKDLTAESTRCITVFRDCLIIDSEIYDICLSCGDVRKGRNMYLLSTEQKNKLKEFKLKIVGI